MNETASGELIFINNFVFIVYFIFVVVVVVVVISVNQIHLTYLCVCMCMCMSPLRCIVGGGGDEWFFRPKNHKTFLMQVIHRFFVLSFNNPSSVL